MRRILALLVFLPVTLGAQTRTVVSGYLAADPAVGDDPLLVGLTVSRERGPVGARLGLGFDVTAPPPRVADSGVAPTAGGIWGMDADGLLFLGNPSGGAALVPYVVVGAGTRGFQYDGRLGVAANYSYGAGFRTPLGVGFAMEGEARHRSNFAELPSRSLPIAASGMEFRAGFSAAFGNRAPRRAPATLPPTIPTRPSGPAGRPVAGTSGSALAIAAISTAERYIGVPYRWGGNSPESGFDCSGFIRYVFQQHGVTVPRVSRDQARYGTSVPVDVRYFQPGDIIAFASDGRTVDHTAIYAGGGRIIHSSSSGRGVRYDDLYSQRGAWYLNHMVAVRRILDGGVMFGG